MGWVSLFQVTNLPFFAESTVCGKIGSSTKSATRIVTVDRGEKCPNIYIGLSAAAESKAREGLRPFEKLCQNSGGTAGNDAVRIKNGVSESHTRLGWTNCIVDSQAKVTLVCSCQNE